MSTVPLSQEAIPTLVPSAIVPRLEQGDNLTRAEFERRYQAMPNCKKAELLEGMVHMPSPVNCDNHAAPHSNIHTWLGIYHYSTPGVVLADNATVRLDNNNEPQPDAVMFIEPARGGSVKLRDGYIEGAPELVVEVAASSVSIDLHLKKKVYLRNGVKEYIAWRVLDHAIDWFVLRDCEYQLLTPDSGGILRSETFPGLWLHLEALLRGELAKVLATIQSGLSDESHQHFVSKLASFPVTP